MTFPHRAPFDSYPHFAAVTPSDSVNLDPPARALYVGGAGNAVLIDSDDNAVTFNGLTAGSVIRVQFKRVNSTSTTATNLVALW